MPIMKYWLNGLGHILQLTLTNASNIIFITLEVDYSIKSLNTLLTMVFNLPYLGCFYRRYFLKLLVMTFQEHAPL